MRTTLDVNEENLKALMRLLGATSRTKAINTAIEEALRSRARERLKRLAGRVQLAEDWRALRDQERRP